MSLLNLVTSKLNQLFTYLPPIAELALRPKKIRASAITAPNSDTEQCHGEPRVR
jgi:hypothetical protein